MASLDITSMIPKVSTQQVLGWVFWTLLVIVILGLIGFFAWQNWKKKKYSEFRCIVWEKDSTGRVHETYDRAGIFLDKTTNFRLFFMQKAKKGLNPNSVPYVTAKDRKGRLIKTVYLRRLGVSNYVYCKMSIPDDGSPMITVGEEDANWFAQEKEKIRRTFGQENMWQKLAPYLMFIITIIITMVILISLFNKFGVLENAAKSLDAVTDKQLEITRLLYNMTVNSTITERNMPIINTPSGGINR